MTRKSIDPSTLELLKDATWLRSKIEAGYSTSRLAKELGTTRTTVEKYRVAHRIDQERTPHELLVLNYQGRTPEQMAEILERRKMTNVERFGVENPFQSEEKKAKISETMRQKYGVDHPLQSPSLQVRKTSTMRTRFGVDHAAQHHLSEDVLKRLGDSDWLKEQHHTLKRPLNEIASELGCDPSTVQRRCQALGIEAKWYYESAQQRELSDWLASQGFNVETNIRTIITGELDIFLPDHKLAIEYCGVFWHSDAHDRITPRYHLNKLTQCQEKGIRLITMFEDEWKHNKSIVKQKLLAVLKRNSTSIPARKCEVVSVTDQNVKQSFFNRTHIQGNGPGSVTYALEHGGDVVAMMTFINQNNSWVLNRFASSVRIQGGFQKLLKHFQRNHKWAEIVSFADRRWSEGEVYFKSGFTQDKILPPDYRYVLGDRTYHKFGFRRSALVKRLANFDPDKSEVQNMKEAGYHRIWNCGLIRFVITNHPH